MSGATVSRIVARARTLIGDREHWVKGPLAMTASGEECSATNTKACKWCLVGALERAAAEQAGELLVREATKEVAVALKGVPATLSGPASWFFVAEWNDDPARKHAEVLDALDAAIARQQEQPEEDQ